MAILTRGSLILADIIVIVATWINVRNQVREALDLHIESKTSIVMLTNGKSALRASFPQYLRATPFTGTLYFV